LRSPSSKQPSKTDCGVSQKLQCLLCKCKAWSSNPSPTKKKKSYEFKITKAKPTGGVAQVAEYLLCKCKALSSNPSPPKNKKQKPLQVSQNNIALQIIPWSHRNKNIMLLAEKQKSQK
jgi:hypothetical protein